MYILAIELFCDSYILVCLTRISRRPTSIFIIFHKGCPPLVVNEDLCMSLYNGQKPTCNNLRLKQFIQHINELNRYHVLLLKSIRNRCGHSCTLGIYRRKTYEKLLTQIILGGRHDYTFKSPFPRGNYVTSTTLKAILQVLIYKALYNKSYLGSKTTMTSGEWTCLISFATAPLTCSERGGSEKFKMKIYVSSGIRTHTPPVHDRKVAAP